MKESALINYVFKIIIYDMVKCKVWATSFRRHHTDPHCSLACRLLSHSLCATWWNLIVVTGVIKARYEDSKCDRQLSPPNPSDKDHHSSLRHNSSTEYTIHVQMDFCINYSIP